MADTRQMSLKQVVELIVYALRNGTNWEPVLLQACKVRPAEMANILEKGLKEEDRG